MKLLTFSASPRKTWLDVREVLNASYWLLARLMANLGEEDQEDACPSLFKRSEKTKRREENVKIAEKRRKRPMIQKKPQQRTYRR